MIRTQIQLDEATHALIKQKAYAENKSLAAVVRDALDQYLLSPGDRNAGLDDFTFIGSGRSDPGTPSPLSERHDEALAQDYAM